MTQDGSYSNEFEAAFDLSRREDVANDDKAKIEALVAAGRWVIGWESERYCRFTDACIGISRWYTADFASEAEAEAGWTEDLDCAFMVGPRVVAEAPVPYGAVDSNEILF